MKRSERLRAIADYLTEHGHNQDGGYVACEFEEQGVLNPPACVLGAAALTSLPPGVERCWENGREVLFGELSWPDGSVVVLPDLEELSHNNIAMWSDFTPTEQVLRKLRERADELAREGQ